MQWFCNNHSTQYYICKDLKKFIDQENEARAQEFINE